MSWSSWSQGAVYKYICAFQKLTLPTYVDHQTLTCHFSWCVFEHQKNSAHFYGLFFAWTINAQFAGCCVLIIAHLPGDKRPPRTTLYLLFWMTHWPVFSAIFIAAHRRNLATIMPHSMTNQWKIINCSKFSCNWIRSLSISMQWLRIVQLRLRKLTAHSITCAGGWRCSQRAT